MCTQILIHEAGRDRALQLNDIRLTLFTGCSRACGICPDLNELGCEQALCHHHQLYKCALFAAACKMPPVHHLTSWHAGRRVGNPALLSPTKPLTAGLRYMIFDFCAHLYSLKMPHSAVSEPLGRRTQNLISRKKTYFIVHARAQLSTMHFPCRNTPLHQASES